MRNRLGGGAGGAGLGAAGVLAALAVAVAAGAGAAGCKHGDEAVCGDGVITAPEGCDDANTAAGDGCAAACAVETGWVCGGQPSVCTTTTGATCGDGVVDASEGCDDGDKTAGDGCDDTCAVEAGFTCAGEPSVCTATTGPVCGDGAVDAAEGCDDGNTAAGDGCDGGCGIEPGFTCAGEPSVCTATTGAVCGDGVVDAGEGCDDAGTVTGDGCDAACAVEAGFACVGEPSVCTATAGPVCGDGVVDASEGCDDGGTATGDGCDAVCAVEAGFTCTGSPSVCTPIGPACGDGSVDPSEGCDDGGTATGDGCDAVCAVEAGFTCTGSPSVCTPIAAVCGDGFVTAPEQCDDANLSNGDGCSDVCLFEATCGNGAVEPGETCDDGNTTPADGCDALCQLEPATTCGDAVDLNDPANVTVSGNVTIYDGTTSGATLVDFGTRSCAIGAETGVATVIHRYTMQGVGVLHIETIDVGGPLGDTILYSYLDCLDPSASDDCDDDGGPGTYSTIATGILPAGTAVYIVLTGFTTGDVGPYELRVAEAAPAPASGTCAAPIVAGAGDYAGETLASDADNDNTSGACGGAGTGVPDAVYEVTLAGLSDIFARVDTQDGGFDPVVYVTDSPCGTGGEEACQDNFGGGASESTTAVDLPAGTYYVFVDGFVAGDVGAYALEIAVTTIIPAGMSCDPNDPTTRCETGFACAGPAGAATCL
ncbi:MAG TPA: DUF4215 domain-containing protein [Myxococcota bacterium]|nr:DUF4215 domain-containing protein [Myxococcota bacterium]